MMGSSVLTNSRPSVSDNLIDCLRALDDFWNSGSNPLPGASVLASAERMAKSGKESSLRDEAIWDDVRDPYRGVRVDDAFRKLAPVQQVCIRTHFFWSSATPLAGIDGGFVVIGARTREMTVAEMSDVIAFAEAFGAERGVRFRAHD